MTEAERILRLLREKHAADVFVEECKDGPTHAGRHLRLDAWVMPRSWVHPETTGYEIKVSRSDFLRDEKWTAYLAMCHRLYFVCPHGLIDTAELPQDVGLMWVAKTGTRLMTKRKAVPREVEIPEDVWRYILMCRATITRERYSKDGVEYWREWLEEKRERQSIGYKVGERIREHIRAADKRARDAEERVHGYEKAAAALAEAGFDINRPISEWDVSRRLRELRGDLPSGLRWKVKHAADALAELVEKIDKIEARDADRR